MRVHAVTHRERLIAVLADGKWHRAQDICSSDRARRELQRLVREDGYQGSWVLVTEGNTVKRIRIVRWPFLVRSSAPEHRWAGGPSR